MQEGTRHTSSSEPGPDPEPGGTGAAAQVDTTADLIAGWLGGAVGVLVLKVRLQTQSSHHSHYSASSSSASNSAPKPTAAGSPRVGKSSFSPLPSPAFPFLPLPARSTDGSSRLASPSTSGLSPASSSSATTTTATKPGIISLYRSEGIRFFFAGTAGPILGLAFIDSAFFGLYGRMMQALGQDRQDPASLSRVALSGAAAGAMCAMLETPIEVVKTRAQVESVPGKKLGSFKIASQIARKEGVRGFYTGGLMTAVHDGISSGIFFFGYFVFRRLLRGEHPFQSIPAPPPPPLSSPASDASTPPPSSNAMGNAEVVRIMLAGGLAGALSAIVPYPFDIVKTRLQTADFATRARTNPVSWAATAQGTTNFTSNATPFHTRPTVETGPAREPSPSSSTSRTGKQSVASHFRAIHAEGVAQYRYRYPSTWVYQVLSRTAKSGSPVLDARAEKWALRVLGLGGFARGIRPTVVSSFVGSAATITTVEVALHLMGVNGGSGGLG
ncbi:hypothetical protein BMF94_5374 [Rhodotorula taiwanensis]|uniref:Uncharacterized protein n=1 Tax=Rhodotorula taiwanensis TaxID=741276 RepID=A0A2S5B480_9BASI|nr:hypothetical protein BMF94_5374 [Rhodotorula taiwanensis]